MNEQELNIPNTSVDIDRQADQNKSTRQRLLDSFNSFPRVIRATLMTAGVTTALVTGSIIYGHAIDGDDQLIGVRYCDTGIAITDISLAITRRSVSEGNSGLSLCIGNSIDQIKTQGDVTAYSRENSGIVTIHKAGELKGVVNLGSEFDTDSLSVSPDGSDLIVNSHNDGQAIFHIIDTDTLNYISNEGYFANWTPQGDLTFVRRSGNTDIVFFSEDLSISEPIYETEMFIMGLTAGEDEIYLSLADPNNSIVRGFNPATGDTRDILRVNSSRDYLDELSVSPSGLYVAGSLKNHQSDLGLLSLPVDAEYRGTQYPSLLSTSSYGYQWVEIGGEEMIGLQQTMSDEIIGIDPADGTRRILSEDSFQVFTQADPEVVREISADFLESMERQRPTILP